LRTKEDVENDINTLKQKYPDWLDVKDLRELMTAWTNEKLSLTTAPSGKFTPIHYQ
jgi:hypothetical protein